MSASLQSIPEVWPPQCCVPAFVHAALARFGVTFKAPAALPAILGVRIAPGDENPLGLAVATDGVPAGLAPGLAEQEINALLRELETSLYLRRIPLNTIAFGLHEDLLGEALRRDLAVGIGVDNTILQGGTRDPSAQHLLRIQSFDGTLLELIDDSGEYQPSQFSLPFERLRRAALAIPDGFWVIGRPESLIFEGALPWSPKGKA